MQKKTGKGAKLTKKQLTIRLKNLKIDMIDMCSWEGAASVPPSREEKGGVFLVKRTCGHENAGH